MTSRPPPLALARPSGQRRPPCRAREKEAGTTEAHFDFDLEPQIDLSDPQRALTVLALSLRSTECGVTSVRVPMRDGAELKAESSAPVTREPGPTILVRSPYGRGFPYDLLLARALAGAGYHVVVRGPQPRLAA
jgi:predicted acyl esterase